MTGMMQMTRITGMTKMTGLTRMTGMTTVFSPGFCFGVPGIATLRNRGPVRTLGG